MVTTPGKGSDLHDLLQQFRSAAVAGQMAAVAKLYAQPQVRRAARRRGLSVAQYADLLLALANDPSPTLEQVFSLLTGSTVPRLGATSKLPAGLREELQAALDVVVADYRSAPRSLAPLIGGKIAERVVIAPKFDDALGLGYVYLPADPEAALYLALAMLCTSEQAADLCRCGYRECQRFFFAERDQSVGAQRRAYCSPEHRELEAPLRTRERVRQWREKQKSKPARPRRSK